MTSFCETDIHYPLSTKTMQVMMAMHDMGENFSETERTDAVDEVMKLIDANHDGTLDVKEFADAMKLAVLAIASAMAKAI